ncbi:MAG: hypothetical protein V4612_00445 [Pseudomonadota bacterium]
MNKKIIILLAFLLAINFSAQSRAENLTDQLSDSFMLKTAFTAEYQGMGIDGNGQNDQFKRQSFGHQLKNFNDIALGFNFRVHKYLGFNLNWSKGGLQNHGVNGFEITKKASLDIENINATSLIYFPIVGDHWLEGFAEIGIADVNSQIKFMQTNGEEIRHKAHETALLYGAGIQFMPYDLDMAFRFGFQKYETHLGFVNAKITTFRGGVVIPF